MRGHIYGAYARARSTRRTRWGGLLLLLLLSAATPRVGAAEGEATPALPPLPAQAEQTAPTAAKAAITFNFQDASLDAVLDFLSEEAGFIVVKTVAVRGRVSAMSRQPVSADEAFALLETLLQQNGYAAVRAGRTVKIIALTQAKQETIPVRIGTDPSKVEASDRVITQVIPLRFVDATKLKDNLTPLLPSYAELSANESGNALILTDTEAHIKRIMEIIQALDGHLGTSVAVKVFPLTYASASNVAKIINEVFKQDDTSSSQQGGFRGFGGFGGPGGPPGLPGSDSSSSSGRKSQKVTASADDRTNTVAVSAPPDVLVMVETVIKEMDSNPAAEQGVFVYNLKNGTASDLATVLTSLFASTSSSSSSSAGTGFGNSALRMGGGPGGGGGSSSGSASTSNTSDLAGQVRVVANADTNSLLVMTATHNFLRVRAIIDELDKPVPQVLIKVLVAEVTHTDARDVGAEFSGLDLNGSGLGSTFSTDFSVAAQTGGLIYNYKGNNFEATLRAMETAGKLEILSRPYILASDQQKASITVGSSVPFVTDPRTTDAGKTINTIEYKDIGIILTVTPHISPDGLVILDVEPEVSKQSSDSVEISETVSAPVFEKRSATSRVQIRDGQTVVIGGLMEDEKTESKQHVPFLGKLPLLGALFRRTSTDTSKTELLFFLTPHIVSDQTTAVDLTKGVMKGTELLPDAVSKGAFQKHMEDQTR